MKRVLDFIYFNVFMPITRLFINKKLVSKENMKKNLEEINKAEIEFLFSPEQKRKRRELRKNKKRGEWKLIDLIDFNEEKEERDRMIRERLKSELKEDIKENNRYN